MQGSAFKVRSCKTKPKKALCFVGHAVLFIVVTHPEPVGGEGGIKINN